MDIKALKRRYAIAFRALYHRIKTILNIDKHQSYYHLGTMALELGNWSASAQYLQQASALDPTYFRANYLLGLVLSKLQRWQEAVDALEKAVALRPADYASLELLAQALIKALEVNDNNVHVDEVVIKQKALVNKMIGSTHPKYVLNSALAPSYPHFLIVGQQKCGTTSLYSYLIKHPQILPALKKEIHFWNENLDLGEDWYLSHFPAIASGSGYITGEASATYLDTVHIVPKIAKILPDIKIIVLLRNPVDRTISHYHMRSRDRNESASMQDAVFSGIVARDNDSEIKPMDSGQDNRYLAGSRYVELLRKWMSVIPREQFLVLRSEDLFMNPMEVVNRTFDFLGVEPHELSNYRKSNSGSYVPIPEQSRQLLCDYFDVYNQQLEDYLGMTFDWS